jgi:RHS repeat-associated protein
MQGFGEAIPDEDPDGDLTAIVQNIRFPGQYFDGESTLFYNYFRDYAPAIGRYLERDPLGLGGGTNTYVYSGANPLSNIDPEGLHYYQRLGNYVPHTHTYPASCSSCDVDFGPHSDGMLDPYSPEHYRLPSCLECDDQLLVCIGPSPALDCAICAASRGLHRNSCLKCVLVSAQAATCVVEHCSEGEVGVDGQCRLPDQCEQ